ncbi:hypothetical protein NIES267_41660 [Calothrix parasitica NIES-267]|uniref:Uncharacterized protein n=1 Tax=Calothrix parasitica NIES-267 TaxID=1973488 RepID=A0A1Z4LTV0_9CYAN|nr:hypothetical protein NIES267_41660 [Calothrix parasitica NIES-267]
MSHLIVNKALKIIDSHAANLLIAQLPVVNSSNSKLYFEDNNAILWVANKELAVSLKNNYIHIVSLLCDWGIKELKIFWNGSGNRYFPISSLLASTSEGLAVMLDKNSVVLEKNPINSAINSNQENSFSIDISGFELPSTYLKNASYEIIQQFMLEMRRRGYIVTATDMTSNTCLMVNDLQAPDRGCGWRGRDWIGLNFLMLWRDSFDTGNFNYYQQLINVVSRDYFISDFDYLLRAPNGDLRRYYSHYFFVDNYLDVPARICVSKPGNWEVVESFN